MMISETDTHYQLIELLAYWQGRVNTTDVSLQFHISRQQAQKYIKQYNQAHPDNIIYDKSAKAFLPSAKFTLHCIDVDVSVYLNWISNHAYIQSFNQFTTARSKHLTNTSLNLPIREVSPYVMRGIVEAIKFQRRLEVDYFSLTNPDGEGRIIQPHTFVKTGLRWHLRAYDEKNGSFRDFVLSRFRGRPELLDKATHTQTLDQNWHQQVQLIFIPDQRLSNSQRAVIENDYQMLDGKLIINSRAALVQYFLQEMRVNIKFHDEIPEAQQLVLANKNDIKQWLFNG
jgi:predicted DNA-binding transcriptional regulator YafY